MEQVIQVIKSDPELSSFYDKDMEDYFNVFMKAIMKGEFEELSNEYACSYLVGTTRMASNCISI